MDSNRHSFELQETKVAFLSFLHNIGYMRVETKILIDYYPEEIPFCDMSTGENTVGTNVFVMCEFLVTALIYTNSNFFMPKLILYLVAVAC